MGVIAGLELINSAHKGIALVEDEGSRAIYF